MKHVKTQLNHSVDLEKLTGREIECLKLTARGFTAKESARELKISHRTVERYIENIKTKLNLENKREITKRFYSEL